MNRLMPVTSDLTTFSLSFHESFIHRFFASVMVATIMKTCMMGRYVFLSFYFIKYRSNYLSQVLFFKTQTLKISSEIIDNNIVFVNIVFSHHEELRRACFEEKNQRH